MIFRFGDHTVDSATRTLRSGDQVVSLTPKVFDTLLVLVENHERVVSKDELLRAIWPETIVEEANLTQNISVLRKALGESRAGTKYIGTFPGRGYRLLEPVAPIKEGSQGAAPQAPASAAGNGAAVLSPERQQSSAGQTSPISRGSNHLLIASLLFLGLAILVSGILFNRSRTSSSQGDSAVLTTPVQTLTRIAGAQFEPAWSPDGRKIAFAFTTPDDSHSGIDVLTRGEMQVRRIIQGSGEYSSPVWSPDGKRLAFVSDQPGEAEVDIFDLATSSLRKLTNLYPQRNGLSCRHLDWSPDGTLLAVDDRSTSTDPLSIYLVYLRNGNKVRLTYPNFNMVGDVAPRFSPDGSQVAFIRMKYQYQFNVFVLPVTGGEAHQVTGHSGIIGDVGWASASEVIFSKGDHGSFRLWGVNLKSSQPEGMIRASLSTPVPFQFSYDRHSSKLVFSAYQPNLDIWALHLPAKSADRGVWTPVIQTPGQDIVPLFSPDGKKIAFRSNVSGRMQIWVSNPDGSHAAPVNTGALVPGVHGWSPDGKAVLFSAMDHPGIYEAGVSEGRPPRRVVSMHVSHAFSSVDGSAIFARTGNFIYRIPMRDGHEGKAVRVTAQGGSPMMESKDGRYLYFAHGRMDTGISRVDLRSGTQQIVLRTLIPGYSDAWTLTPKGIILLEENDGRPGIALHDVATGKERILAPYPGPLPPIGTSGFSLSPDGHTLLSVRVAPSPSNIQAIDLSAGEAH